MTLAGIPEQPGRARERWILDQVIAGRHDPIAWVTLDWVFGGHRYAIRFASDALKIDGVRVNVSHATAQRIADVLGLWLPTSKISDLIHASASVVLRPKLGAPDSAMASTARMLQHSRLVDVDLRGRIDGGGHVSTVGKDWVNTSRLEGRPDRAANYGWHDTAAPNGKVWQTVGLAHDRDHVDYSQTLRLVARQAGVDGELIDIAELAAHPVHHGAVSDEGPLRVLRHPGVALEDSRAEVAPKPKSAPPPVDREAETPRLPSSKPPPPTPKPPTPAATTKPSGVQPDDPSVTSFVQARNYTPARRVPVDLVVLHSMEAAESARTAENVAAWTAGASAPRASFHYAIDSDSTVQCVREADVAWHAPGANHNGVGIELAGYARQTPADWADAFSTAMLERAARLVAGVCRRHAVPVAFVDAAGLLRGESGVTTHAEVSKAWKKSSHWDPGKGFDMAGFLVAVQSFSDA